MIRNLTDTFALNVSLIDEVPALTGVLEATELITAKRETKSPHRGDHAPISLPVMQADFGDYPILLFEGPEAFSAPHGDQTRGVTRWAITQMATKATAMCHLDPIISPTIIPRGMYRGTRYRIARDALECIGRPTATHMAAGTDSSPDKHSGLLMMR